MIPLVGLDVAVPSPCAQRAGEHVTHFVYGRDRFLTELFVDDDGDGRAEVHVVYVHDGEGRPLRSFHDDDGDGDVDRVNDCRAAHCTTNWIPVCPSGAECSRNELGLVERMSFGSGTIVNDYTCWAKVDGTWTYRRPELPVVRATTQE